jgi:hypothetical protein
MFIVLVLVLVLVVALVIEEPVTRMTTRTIVEARMSALLCAGFGLNLNCGLEGLTPQHFV